LNEDNTYSLHVTPPLRKHFVSACALLQCYSIVNRFYCHLSTELLL
jgi:hypothetical protein